MESLGNGWRARVGGRKRWRSVYAVGMGRAKAPLVEGTRHYAFFINLS
ncbi:hypothetical protein ETAR_22560 [Edwardsiella tarda]|nr:hypothetical protein GBS0709_21970 [Edwardsiella tarda]